MTKHLAVLALSLMLTGIVSAQNSGKTFTKPFSTDGATRIKFDLPGPIDLKIWHQATIRVEISVDLPSGSTSMLDQLAKVGRYDLAAENVDNELVITSPNMHRVVRVIGEKLRENLSYVIYVPKDMDVVLLNSAAALADIQNK